MTLAALARRKASTQSSKRSTAGWLRTNREFRSDELSFSTFFELEPPHVDGGIRPLQVNAVGRASYGKLLSNPHLGHRKRYTPAYELREFKRQKLTGASPVMAGKSTVETFNYDALSTIA